MNLKLPNLQTNIALAPFTTYQIGGPADYFVQVTSAEGLVAAITAARQVQLPFFILGTGANILISDAGFRGLVIHNQAAHIVWLADSKLRVESGAVVVDLIMAAQAKGLSGLEHFAGIPSSVGGAMRQNLHFLAPDRQSTLFIAELVDSATVLMADGSTRVVDRDYFRFGYDDSILHHESVVVLEVTVQLQPKPAAEIQAQAEANLAWRNTKQPQLVDNLSCGSVFKKIDGVGAGRLIDQAGLKGYRQGGIQVSDKHANYLVNRGDGTAADVLAVIEHVQETVQAATGYKLEPEIGFIGFN
jgi:UDP-N-acetylmuramate dehydrogenase